MDSPLSEVANPSLRRMELLTALANMSEYANNNGVAAIIVAGDLFDDKFATEQTVRSVAEIVKNSRAAWFVLKGNHGGSEPYALLQKISNVQFFGDDWTYFSLGNVTICGRELNGDASPAPSLDPSRYNIIVLHGDIDSPDYGFVDKKALAQSGAKYVALGHRHTFSEHRFGNVRACYSGVLEARGFDECAETGFVEIDTDSDRIRFVKQTLRSVVTKKLDVSGIQSDVALERAVSDAVSDVSPRNYLNFEFTGELFAELHLRLVANALKDRFFALRIKDNTRARLDIAAITKEVSLRGEFVKLAMNISDESVRNDVIKLGLAALSGEELQ